MSENVRAVRGSTLGDNHLVSPPGCTHCLANLRRLVERRNHDCDWKLVQLQQVGEYLIGPKAFVCAHLTPRHGTLSALHRHDDFFSPTVSFGAERMNDHSNAILEPHFPAQSYRFLRTRCAALARCSRTRNLVTSRL